MSGADDVGDRIEKVKLALLTMQRCSWEHGVAAQAFLEMGWEDLVVLMAKEAVHRQCEDGRLAVVGPNDWVTDPGANGEAVLRAWEITGDPVFRDAADRMLNYLMNRAPRAPNGALLHFSDDRRPWVLIDSIYHAPTFMAVMGRYEEAVRQVEAYRALIFDAKKQLYRALLDVTSGIWRREACWGGGNGWTAAALARVIPILPHRMGADRQRLIGYAREAIDGCLVHQRDDGLFHDVVDDPATFVETNLGQMLAYAIYRGIADGWLGAGYRESADRMRKAAHSKVDPFGLVQDVASAPGFDRPGVSPEGQAFFLLMEAAVRALDG